MNGGVCGIEDGDMVFISTDGTVEGGRGVGSLFLVLRLDLVGRGARAGGFSSDTFELPVSLGMALSTQGMLSAGPASAIGVVFGALALTSPLSSGLSNNTEPIEGSTAGGSVASSGSGNMGIDTCPLVSPLSRASALPVRDSPSRDSSVRTKGVRWMGKELSTGGGPQMKISSHLGARVL